MRKDKQMDLETIERFAGRTGVKRMAVENFLMSLHPCNIENAQENLIVDVRLYSWNAKTRDAILAGIREFKK